MHLYLSQGGRVFEDPDELVKFLCQLQWFLDQMISESASRSAMKTPCLPGFSVHGILQARILEWVAISFSRGSSQVRDWTQVSCLAGTFFTVWATKKANKWWEIGLIFNLKQDSKKANFKSSERVKLLHGNNSQWKGVSVSESILVSLLYYAEKYSCGAKVLFLCLWLFFFWQYLAKDFLVGV